ncbi:MAG: chloramphenicol acetyltransferase [Saprospiraceae bacterium]|nr:MAG: chloramphenicol acetyltransferase [Saprospiraceae bacterium]
MKNISFNDRHRQKHFDFFRSMNHPHFSICANVSVTELYPALKSGGFRFMPAVAWLVSRAANEIPELRQRIRGEQVVEHEVVHPSFSIATEASDVFSFCEVDYSLLFHDFMERATAKIARMQTDPTFEDEAGRDDYLYLSSLPWIAFTGVQHAMHYHPHDSVPRITWGKVFEENGHLKMPLSIQAHHALVDGRHAGQFYQNVEQFCTQPTLWLKP